MRLGDAISLMGYLTLNFLILVTWLAVLVGVYQWAGGKFYFRCWFVEIAIGEKVEFIIGRRTTKTDCRGD